MKKKICFVAEDAIGGVIYVIIYLYEQLKKTFDIEVVLLNYSWRNVASAEDILKEKSIQYYKINISHTQNKFKILKHLGKNILSNYDLIITSSIYELTAISIAGYNKGVIMMVHGDTELEYKMLKYLNDYNIIDLFIPISNKIFNSCQKFLSSKQIKYLRHSIPENSVPITNQYSKDFTIIFVGRYNKIKGYDKLISIGKRLFLIDKKINFIFITDGIGEEDFKNNWIYKETSTFFHKLPNSEVHKYYAQSNIILSPSRNEGLPLTLIEAMRKGVVPITTNLETGFKEVITEGKNGFMCDFENTNCFVEKILKLKNNRKLLDKLSNNALSYVETHYNYDKNVKAYETAFIEVIKQKKIKTDKLKNSYILGKLDKPYIPNFIFKILKK